MIKQSPADRIPSAGPRPSGWGTGSRRSPGVFHPSFFLLLIFLSIGARASAPDVEAPTLITADPPAGRIVTELAFIGVVFSESVSGINASDLLINNIAATGMTTVSPREYQFTFPAPPTGIVQVAFAPDHGVVDLAPVPNVFAGTNWTFTLDPGAVENRAIISEFMAANTSDLSDEDGDRSDWIEIYNPSTVAVNLRGWYLTDNAANRVKWRFPDATLAPNRFLVVWASGKDRTITGRPLHTNFRLAAGGGYLALVRPDGLTVASAFSPYPPQFDNNSYGVDRLDPSLQGFFVIPTPGSANATTGIGYAAEPIFNYESGVYTNDSLLLTITAPAGGTIRYTTNGTEPTNASSGLAYTGPITISANTPIKARVFQPGVWPSAVKARNFILLDNTTKDFTSNLPLVIIATPGAIPSSVPATGARMRGTLAVIDTACGRAALTGKPDYIGPGQFETFGQTSEGFAKKPHNIEINDEFGADQPASLLGLPPAADWKLTNPYSDKPLVNNFLAFELFEQMGHYQTRRRLVEVFLNPVPGTRLNYANYYGVLILVEKIEVGQARVNIAELTSSQTNEPAVTGGYIFKRDKDSTGDLNFTTANGTAFKMHEPKPRDLTGGGANPQVQWLRQYLSRYEAAVGASDWLTRTGTNHYSHYLNLDSFVDFHWIVEFTKNIDAYRTSNFFTKDRSGKIKNSPIWDWNLSFGNANYLEGGKTNGWYYTQLGDGDHVFLRRLVGTSATTGDPDFKQRIVDRWSVLRTNILSGERVLQRIDELATHLGEAAVRNYLKYPILSPAVSTWPNPNGSAGGWNVDYVNPTNYAGIINEMKKWTWGRYLWIDAQFIPAPRLTVMSGIEPSQRRLELAATDGVVLYTLDGTDPRLPGGAISPRALTYAGPILLSTQTVVLARVRRAPAWQGTTWSGPVRYPENALISPLVITEIMYAPAPLPAGTPSTFGRQDFEFIEVCNISGQALPVSGFTMRGGIEFDFPDVTLDPGQYAVITRNLPAFVNRYGPGLTVLGEFAGALANDSDRLVLSDPNDRVLLDCEYSSHWHRATAGLGFSLCAIDVNRPLDAWSRSEQWRPSAAAGGSPGIANPTPPQIPSVVVNEVLSNPAEPFEDSIELLNPGSSPADISGWFLSDDFAVPRKYRLPDGAVLAPGQYLALDEHTFNPSGGGGSAAGVTPFSFAANGDDVYLFSADTNGVLTGYVHGFSFGAAEANVPFGRHVVSTGDEHFIALSGLTLAEPNAEPLVGPLVISRIHYHPPPFDPVCVGSNNIADEFIELRNITAAPISLHEPAVPDGAWRLRDAVEYRFPTNLTLPPRGRIVVTSLDASNPAAIAGFRARNAIPNRVPVLGPWEGGLDNDGDSVELMRPALVRGIADEIRVERVRYSNHEPWPTAADGGGELLQRIDERSFGDDPINWRAAYPLSVEPDPDAVQFLLEPRTASLSIVAGGEAQLDVAASGAAIAGYQWYFNGRPITGATDHRLVLAPVSFADAGVYQLLVFTVDGGFDVATLTLSVLSGAKIIEQPRSIDVRVRPDPKALASTNASFSIQATTSNPPLIYQWRFNDVDIPGANASVLTLMDVTTNHYGDYSCAVSDANGTVFSQHARLHPLVDPIILVPPIGQTVPAGGLVGLSVQYAGFPPPFSVEWRIGSTPLTNYTTDKSISQFAFRAVPTNSTFQYRAVIKNRANPTPGIATVQAPITTISDTDGDGIPDSVETALGLDPDDPADGRRDLDGDTMSNSAEQIAGTDPRDPQSYLRIRPPLFRFPGESTGPSLEFLAISNRTYSVEAQDTLGPAPWRLVSEVVATPTNRLVTVIDPHPTGTNAQRLYRLVTPRHPTNNE